MVCIEAGVFPNEGIRNGFLAAQKTLAPSVRFIWADGQDETCYRQAWQGADVFVSLSDNIQETFGLTPVEAMAAGLPVVVSDWNGYKDTVRDGVDGFRIATLMPQAGLGGDLALRHALEIDTYDMYCGHTCSLVAVDVQAAAQAFSRLFASAELCRQMGEAGRQRAREEYDWAAIIPRYEALWAQLAEIRQAQASDLKLLAHPWPARMDPFAAFAGYPTRALTPQTVLELADSDADAAVRRVAGYRALAMVSFAKAVLPSDAEVQVVLDAASGEAKPAAELVQGIAPERQAQVFRALAWLAKLGVLKVADHL